MRGTIQLKMIGWELTQNNNIICIFLRKLKYFSSTSTIIYHDLAHLPVRHRCMNNWELDALYDTINYLINPVSVAMTSPGVIRCSGSSFSTFCFFNREHASFISTAILRMLLPFTNGFLKSAIPTFQSANHFRYGFSRAK